ncbi:MAG: RrF2 family transcriptional regulator [Flavobacteriaceae bacterium]
MISKKCKYAIKAILYLAKQQPTGKPIFSTEIAEREKIPQKFLETILRELRNYQIVQSRRGKTGGYFLLKSPDEIKLTDLIRFIDGPIALLPCVSMNYYSPCEECDESTCTIKPVFEKVRDQTLSILGNTTIAMMREKI